MKQESIVLEDITAPKAKQRLLELPKRYRNYIPKDEQGKWRIDHMSDNKGTVHFMVLDTQADVSKGNSKPECPVFQATLEQQEADVFLNWKQKWQTSTLVLGLIYAVLTLAILAGGIYFMIVQNWLSGIACLCAFLIAAVMILVYLIQGAKRNARARHIFLEIIEKNFTVAE